MSDTADDDIEFMGRQLLKKSRTIPLRERMTSFVSEHERPENFKTVRRRAASGQPLSEIVEENRDERM